MAKVYGKRIAAKLTGDKQTTVWISGKHMPIVNDLGVSNQEFAQAVYDAAMGFVVQLDLKSDKILVIDSTGKNPIDAELAKILAAEVVRNFRKEKPE